MSKRPQSICRSSLLVLISGTLSLAVGSAVSAQSAAPSGGRGAGAAAASYTDLGYGQYPRVTEIEQQLLGKTYENEPLTTRVARLETKQFGKPSPKDDLADRLDRLDQFVKKSAPAQDDSDQMPTAGNGAASSPGYSAAQPPAGTSPAGAAAASGDGQPQYSASDYGNYPRVTELEQQFLGTTYVKDPLPVRVARLETKQFGKPCPNEDLCDRIDKLDKMANAANPKRNAQVAARDAASSGPDGGGANGGRGGKAGSLGKTLLGLLGGAMGGGMLGSGMGMMPGAMLPSVQDDMRKSAGGKQQQQQGAAAAKPAQPTSPFATGAEPVTGAENRIAIIEKLVLGREHSELPLSERVQHVEKKLVPYEHHQAGQDLNLRVDHLWSILAAANKQSTKSVAAAQGSTQ